MLPVGTDDLVRADQVDGRVPSPIREGNAELIATLLRQRGPLSRAELVRESGLTRPTVVAIVRSLMAEGMATERGVRRPAEASGTGRPGTLLHFNTRVRTIVACGIWGGVLSARLVDAHGTVLAESKTPIGVDPAVFLSRAAQAIAELSRAVPDVGPLGAVSVLMPGLISQRTGELISHPRRDDWRQLPVRAELERTLGVPVTVLTPASAAVLGEAGRGAARGHQNIALVFLDVGIAAGIVTGGRLIRGSDGLVGELGHCRIGDSTEVCDCGGVGCLETVASGRHILRETRRILGDAVGPGTGLGDLEAIGDDRVDEVLTRAARALGVAASWLVNLLNPSIVVLGGTNFVAGAPRFFATFQGSVRDNLLTRHPAPPAFAISDGEAALHGGVQAALERLPRRLRPPLCYDI